MVQEERGNTMKLVEYHNGGPAEDGLHLPGLDAHDAETLCGHAWSGYKYDTVTGQFPTCKNCVEIAKELFINRGYTKAQVAKW
jgi:hypothetical protein